MNPDSKNKFDLRGGFVPGADIAPAQHYVLITGDQVVFYKVYTFLNTS